MLRSRENGRSLQWEKNQIHEAKHAGIGASSFRTIDYVPQPCSRKGLRYRDCVSGIHQCLPRDGTTGLWNDHVYLYSGRAMCGIEVVEIVLAAIPRPGNLLRTGVQPFA